MFLALNKAALLAFYAAVLASFAVALPASPEVLHWARIVAGVLLVAHALEVVVFFRQVSLYKGPVALSIAQTLLFGFLHWKPLADDARAPR